MLITWYVFIIIYYRYFPWCTLHRIKTGHIASTKVTGSPGFIYLLNRYSSRIKKRSVSIFKEEWKENRSFLLALRMELACLCWNSCFTSYKGLKFSFRWQRQINAMNHHIWFTVAFLAWWIAVNFPYFSQDGRHILIIKTNEFLFSVKAHIHIYHWRGTWTENNINFRHTYNTERMT